MKRRLILAALALCAAALAACTRPYDTPKIEPEEGSPIAGFDGVRDVIARGDTRIIWVHGMCTHRDEWADKRYGTFIGALDRDAPAPSAKTKEMSGGAKVIAFSTIVNGNNLDVSFPMWSPLTAQAKRDLEFDAPPPQNSKDTRGEFIYQRASLNNTLKVGLMNDCLVDAVAYSGPAGDRIRSFMRASLCDALGGRLGPDGCDIPSSAAARQTIFVAESLGSKMLFDAVRDIWPRNRAGQAKLARQFASVQNVFLLANQIPILDAAGDRSSAARARVAGAPAATIATTLSVLRAARASTKSVRAVDLPPVQVVAFTDPNDLLSYRLTKRALRLDDATVVNVIVSNDDTYLGLVERPDTAHCGYGWNANVRGYLVNGWSGGGATPIPVESDKKCGF